MRQPRPSLPTAARLYEDRLLAPAGSVPRYRTWWAHLDLNQGPHPYQGSSCRHRVNTDPLSPGGFRPPLWSGPPRIVLDVRSWLDSGRDDWRLIDVEDWAEIRRLHRAEAMGIKTIARRLGPRTVCRISHRQIVGSSGSDGRRLHHAVGSGDGRGAGPTGPPEESAGSGFRQGGGARNRESLRLGGADDRPRASRCSLDRETSASFAPSAAIKRAVSAPSPLLPPVMTATLSVSFKSIGIRHPRRQSVGVWNCAVGGPAGRTRAPLANSTCTRAKPWSIAR